LDVVDVDESSSDETDHVAKSNLFCFAFQRGQHVLQSETDQNRADKSRPPAADGNVQRAPTNIDVPRSSAGSDASHVVANGGSNDARRGPSHANDVPRLPVVDIEEPRATAGGELMRVSIVDDDSPQPSYSESPRVPSYTESPRVVSWSESPRVPSLNESPRVPSYTESPRVPSLNESPRVPSYTESPRVPSLNESPRVPSYNDSPRVPSGNESPRASSYNDSPRESSTGGSPRLATAAFCSIIEPSLTPLSLV
jgi:hypothetical protein